MEASVKNENTNEEITPGRGDPGPLVESLRKNILERITGINSAADRDIELIDGDIRKEIADFTAAQLAKHEDIVRSEGARIKNLASTAIKKQRLEGIESFINAIIDEAAGSIRNDPRYPDLLKRCIKPGLDNIKGASATILVSDDDLKYSGAISEMISAAGYKPVTRILADKSIKTGGAMVIDDELEVVYNNTVERILYRKKDLIRREIVKSLKDSGVYKDG